MGKGIEKIEALTALALEGHVNLLDDLEIALKMQNLFCKDAFEKVCMGSEKKYLDNRVNDISVEKDHYTHIFLETDSDARKILRNLAYHYSSVLGVEPKIHGQYPEKNIDSLTKDYYKNNCFIGINETCISTEILVVKDDIIFANGTGLGSGTYNSGKNKYDEAPQIYLSCDNYNLKKLLSSLIKIKTGYVKHKIPDKIILGTKFNLYIGNDNRIKIDCTNTFSQ